MDSKILIFVIAAVCCILHPTTAVAVPVGPAAYVAPYASSYNAHYVNHAIAAPVSAPLTAAYTHYPLPAAYAAYAAYPYNAPLVVAK